MGIDLPMPYKRQGNSACERYYPSFIMVSEWIFFSIKTSSSLAEGRLVSLFALCCDKMVQMTRDMPYAKMSLIRHETVTTRRQLDPSSDGLYCCCWHVGSTSTPTLSSSTPHPCPSAQSQGSDWYITRAERGCKGFYTQVWRDQPREIPKGAQPPRGFPEADPDTRGE